MKKSAIICLIAVVCLIAQTGQYGIIDARFGLERFPQRTFAQFPPASLDNSGQVFVLSNALTAYDCSAGGGTTAALCMSNGSSYVSISGRGPTGPTGSTGPTGPAGSAASGQQIWASVATNSIPLTAITAFFMPFFGCCTSSSSALLTSTNCGIQVENYIPIAGTMSKFWAVVEDAQEPSGSLVMTIIKNSTATALTVTLAADGAGPVTLVDNTHTVSVAAGDTFCLRIVNNATMTGNQVVDSFGVVFTPTP